ncbi:MAG: FAD-dependent oxidoreductase [Immundisolibacteraceae bacterium]|nr:FAD-dependent oxidoreductase [Immundisolibacteraceae bacterium]
MKRTEIRDPEYIQKVVDCQHACPAHTNVPEYIRLIAAERYDDAYMLNWHSNVFPGVLGRTCDRPCEPACRRGRVEEKPVAICRLKRVAADNKGDISRRMPEIPTIKNGKRIALIGAGPASLAVARDLMPLGYHVELFERERQGGGFMRTQIPSFRLPAEVLDEEVDQIINMGVKAHFGTEITSLQALLEQDFDAIFVGTGAPRGNWLNIPGAEEAGSHIHIGIDWLSNVHFEHTEEIGTNVVVIGGGNTAMDCCRTALRLGGKNVTITVRSGFDEMKASEWEKEDAMAEGVPFLNYHQPLEYLTEDGKLVGMKFQKVRAEFDDKGRRKLIATDEAPVTVPCDDVLVAIGQSNAFPWIERDGAIEFDKRDMPVVNEETFQSSNPKVFFGGDAAFGPKNIITAVAHGHAAAISIDLFCNQHDISERPAKGVNLISQKMGLHDWTYNSLYDIHNRRVVPQVELEQALASLSTEVEIGFDLKQAYEEAGRCLNCDVQTVFTTELCIECDACVDICPTDCITFTPDQPEAELRENLSAPSTNLEQDIYVSSAVKTGRVMVKDEDVCLHCGLCAERCPTSAWDMQKSILKLPQAGGICRN